MASYSAIFTGKTVTINSRSYGPISDPVPTTREAVNQAVQDLGCRITDIWKMNVYGNLVAPVQPVQQV